MSSFSKVTSALRMALLRVLKGTVCPTCGRSKAERQAFCKTCYFALPDPLRNLLYTEIDVSGEFEDHYLKAMRDLKRRGMTRKGNLWSREARAAIVETGIIPAMKEYADKELKSHAAGRGIFNR